MDLPKYWEFVGEIIGLILVKVYEADSSRSKDVFREVSKALGEVAGKDYLRLTNSVKQTINDKVSFFLLLCYDMFFNNFISIRLKTD